MKFCSECGKTVTWRIPSGEDRKRHVCNSCDTIHYQNPRVITGCLPIYQDKILLCKRAIEPRLGLWTSPAGFLENGETSEEGAIRESWEEARTNLRINHLYTLFNLPHVNQLYFFYHATMTDMKFSAGPESLTVALFRENEIPWDSLAFAVVERTLQYYFNDKKTGDFMFRTEVINKKS